MVIDIATEIDKFLDLIGHERNPVTTPDFHQEVPHLIIQYLLEFNIAKTEIHTFDWHGYTGNNVIIPPPKTDEPFTLIMGHHDSVPESPGVDDNGSGMAITAILAAWYHQERQNGKLQNLNVAFFWPDYEEGDPRVWDKYKDYCTSKDEPVDWQKFQTDLDHMKDYFQFLEKEVPDRSSLIGTRKYVEMLKNKGHWDKLNVVINFETIGYIAQEQKQIPNVPFNLEQGNFMAVAVNDEYRHLVPRLNECESPLPRIVLPIPEKGHPIPDSRRSDHSVFWDEGKAAIFVTDTANFRNPHYHLKSDVKIDKSFITAIIEFFKTYLINTI